MRLRLVIRRNGIPDANILWSTKGLHSIPQGSHLEPTIAQFLLQVNEVVPLESEDWGLEDYVVEVGGFECVHFSTLESVLKENDQVLIRPLELNDRRFRRVSGRIQIAADGRRLYDGVAFGRPFLRKSYRPPVRIPSVKRARITHDEDEDGSDDQLVEPNQLVLREDDTEEDDSEFVDDLTPEEIAALAAENASYEEPSTELSQHLTTTSRAPRRKTGLGIRAIGISPSNTAGSLSSRLRSQRSDREHIRVGSFKDSPKNVRFDTEELDTPATILDMDETEDSDDDDYDSDNESDVSEANKENVAPVRRSHNANVQDAAEHTDESGSDSSEATSSSGSDSSDSDDSDSSSDTDSDVTSSDSSSDSSEEMTSNQEESGRFGSTSRSPSKSKITQKNPKIDMPVFKSKTNKEGPEAKAAIHQPSSNLVAPGNGSEATKRRNARRKKALQRRRKKAKEENGHQSVELEQTKLRPLTLPGAAETRRNIDEVKKRKLALLQNLAQMDGIESMSQTASITEQSLVSVDFNKSNAIVKSIERQSRESSTRSEDIAASKQLDQAARIASDRQSQAGEDSSELTKELDLPSKDAEHETAKATPRRSKLDLGSAKRMLFGSLGLRAPKSKEDADKLRDKLETKAQKLPGSMIGPVQPSMVESSVVTAPAAQDDDSWKDGIELMAVECCYDGVEYSAPPFPFVQRWDPQQQYNNKRKGRGKASNKSKRQKRNNSQYYQGNEWDEYSGYYNDNSVMQDTDQILTEDPETAHPDTSMQTDQDLQAANDQLLAESMIASAEAHEDHEYPTIPEDVSSLPVLTEANAIAGNVIVFKQMEMSEYTSWSPVISDCRTAIIEAVLPDGILAVRLAPRDVPSQEKHYDPETGERVYSKFEMPDEDENEDEENLGYLEIGLQDMIEPKILLEHQSEKHVSATTTSIDIAVENIKGVLDAGKKLIGAAFSTPASDGKDEDSPRDDDAQEGDDKSSTLSEPHESKSLARELSVELGSHEPSRRFRSEDGSSSVPEEVVHMGSAPFADQNWDEITESFNLNTTKDGDSAIDDPSLWQPSSGTNNEGDTQFFSPQNAKLEQQPFNHQDEETSANTASATRNSPAVEVVEVVDDWINLKSDLIPVSIAVDNTDGHDVEVLSQYDDELDKTLTQDVHDSRSESSQDITNSLVLHNESADEDIDVDSESSSLMSLKDLLSQPVHKSISPPKIKHAQKRKSKYPKIPSNLPEPTEEYILSQAPKRVISDTHKIAIQPDENDFLLSDTSDSDNGPHELEAYNDDPALPELPATSTSAPGPGSGSGSSITASSPSRKARVVDLTFSSDPAEPADIDIDQETTKPKRKQPARRVASSMPSGPGWVGKDDSLTTGGAAKSKAAKRNMKRTKSLV